jgi:hypothetical protein
MIAGWLTPRQNDRQVSQGEDYNFPMIQFGLDGPNLPALTLNQRHAA